MIGFVRDKDKYLTSYEMVAYIDAFNSGQLPRLKRLKNYYDTKNEYIGNRTMKDETKPNNKTATPYAEYITTLLTGYFIGKPVTYETGDATLSEYLGELTRRNKDTSHNQRLAKTASIYGVAYELLYMDQNKQVKYTALSPETVIPIFSNSIERNLDYAIRYYKTKDIISLETVTYVSLYTPTTVQEYRLDNAGYTLLSTSDHYFNQVPINIYYNNEDATGDFEKVIPLIDAYDIAISDTSNFREELNDSYLVFKNTNLETEDVLSMKASRIICIEDAEDNKSADIMWLNKDTNDSENENHKRRLDEDIKKFSYVSDLENAKSHTTATSAKIGLMGIEQVCSDKESHFREGLMRRFAMVGNVERLKGYDFNTDSINITFVRNIPIDLTVIADTVVKLAPFVSRESLLAQIPFINDISLEIERKEKENQLRPIINSYDTEVNEEDEQ